MKTSSFSVKSCTLAAIATGEHAISIVELYEKLASISIDSIYYHFWGNRLVSQSTHPLYFNDFAIWAHSGLNDDTLAERLSILDPTEYTCLENLRIDVLDVLEQRSDEYTSISFAKKTDLFYFIRSTIIVFDTPYIISHPSNLPKIIDKLSVSSFFYHFIDARTRTKEKCDDFSAWLGTYDDKYSLLIKQLKSIDLYLLSIASLRDEVIKVIKLFFENHKEEQNVKSS